MLGRGLSFIAVLACGALGATPGRAQSWSALKSPPPAGVQLCLLLTDGAVMCQAETVNRSLWYKLTPDATGSYLNGSWSSVAPMPSGYVPLAGTSAVLGDGRVVMLGGEYNNLNFTLTNMGAIYNPQADTWSVLPSPPFDHFQCIGDAAGTVLADGRLIIGSKLFKDLAILDPATLTWTLVAAANKIDVTNSEEGYTLLPDGSFFTADVESAPATERFLLTGPATGTWVSAGNTPQPLNTTGVDETLPAPGCPPYEPAGEMGPAMLRPDGTVFAIGANGKTAIYTPPPAGSSQTGTWVLGPSFPGNVEDGPAAVLPSGHVLFGSSPGAIGPGLRYFEFDGTTLVSVPAPANAAQDATTGTGLLLLPTGQVLFADGSTKVQLYNPAASPTYAAAWAPLIKTVPLTLSAGTTYQVTGTQFNGLNQGSAFGDEYQNSTNYPLVRIINKDSGHVTYARTHGHSSMGVATGSLEVSTNFDVPTSSEPGASTLELVANGIPSAPVAVTVVVPSAGTPPAIATAPASDVTATTAVLNATANPAGADTQVWFEYAANSSLSGSLSTPHQDIGSGNATVLFSANLTGLAGSTTYYFRAWASHSAAATAGVVQSFTQTSGPAGFTTIGPDNSFSLGSVCITGAATTVCGPAATRSVAASFTPGAAFPLRSLAVALRHGSGANSAQLSLLDDTGGLPGNTLETWTLTNLPSTFPPSLTTVGDPLGLNLQANRQYWVEVSAASPDTQLSWSVSSFNLGGAMMNTNGTGWQTLAAAGTIPVFQAGSSAPPAINSGGVVSAGAFGAIPSVSPGGWIEIYGANLASGQRSWTAGDFNAVFAPVELDGTSVLVGGQPAFVSFISPNQVNVQVPFELAAGPQPLVVTTRAGGSTNPYTITVEPSPGLLAPPSFKIAGRQFAAALFPDYSTYVLPAAAIAGVNSRPVRSGETVILYGVGFGSAVPDIAAGRTAVESTTLAAPFRIFFGGLEAKVDYSGLAPNYVGLYQFNVVVPQTAGGTVPLTFTLGGSQGAQTLYLALE